MSQTDSHDEPSSSGEYLASVATCLGFVLIVVALLSSASGRWRYEPSRSDAVRTRPAPEGVAPPMAPDAERHRLIVSDAERDEQADDLLPR
jgi:hypothetical protein